MPSHTCNHTNATAHTLCPPPADFCSCSNQCSAGLGLGLFTFSEQAEDTHKELGGEMVQKGGSYFLSEF